MTQAVVYIQRCMVVLAVFLCYFHIRGEKLADEVDCEKHPFHIECRGSMSRKRTMFPNIYRLGCDGSEGNVNCIRELEERHHRIPYSSLSLTKLLMTLLDNDLQRDAAYSARHKQRNNEMDERRLPVENFLSELESSDTNY